MMLKVEFEEQVWSRIIDILADRPYKETAQIINSIAQQFNEQRPQQPQQSQQAPMPPERPASRSRNGRLDIDAQRSE